jgi:C4-dicarboxylate transporter, DctM subunit
MDPNLAGVLALILILVLLSLGVHIGFTMALVAFLGIAILGNVDKALSTLGMMPYSTILSYVLIAVPLFIAMGQFALHAGIASKVYSVGYKWLGRLPGGLAMATVFGAALFAAATGSSVACAATMAKIALPEMEKYRYDIKLATASVAAAGTLGILIPPSIPIVIYAVLTNVPVGATLLAGFIPGVLSALMYMSMIMLRVRLNPQLAPKSNANITWGEKLASLKDVWGIVILFVLVMGTIFAGIATPTEAAAMGAVGAMVIGLVQRRLSKGQLWQSITESVSTTAMIFLIFIGTYLFSVFVAYSGVSLTIGLWLKSLALPPTVVMIIVLLMYLPMGCFLDTLSMILLTMPIVWPVLKSLGIDGIWFGILVVKLMEIGLLTPPVGMNCFTVKSIAGPSVKLETVFAGIIWFVIADLITVTILIIFPEIVLFLPNLMGK